MANTRKNSKATIQTSDQPSGSLNNQPNIGISSSTGDRDQSQEESEFTVKQEILDSLAYLEKEEKNNLANKSTLSASMSSSNSSLDSHNFAVLGFHPITTDVKIPELKQTDQAYFRAWKIQVESVALKFGVESLIKMENDKSERLAILDDNNQHSVEAVKRNWKAAHRKFFAAIKMATVSKTGESFYGEIVKEQEATDLAVIADITGKTLRKFIQCNAHYLMKKLTDKYDSWNHMKSAHLLKSLFTDLKYKQGEDPGPVKQIFEEAISELENHGLKVDDGIKTSIWLTLIPTDWLPISMALSTKENLEWKEVYSSIYNFYNSHYRPHTSVKTLGIPDKRMEDLNSVDNPKPPPRGTPSGRGRGRGGRGRGAGTGTRTAHPDTVCYNCGKKGHWERDCRSKKTTKGEAIGYESNNVDIIPYEDLPHGSDKHEEVHAVDYGSEPSLGILDSGIGKNTTPFEELIDNREKLPTPLVFRSASRNLMKAKERGMLWIDKERYIPNVYHLPGSSRTLISEYQIVRSMQTIFKDRNFAYIVSRAIPESDLKLILETVRKHTIMKVPLDHNTGFWTMRLRPNDGSGCG